MCSLQFFLSQKSDGFAKKLLCVGSSVGRLSGDYFISLKSHKFMCEQSDFYWKNVVENVYKWIYATYSEWTVIMVHGACNFQYRDYSVDWRAFERSENCLARMVRRRLAKGLSFCSNKTVYFEFNLDLGEMVQGVNGISHGWKVQVF